MKLKNQTIPIKLEIRRITKVKNKMSWTGFEFGYQVWMNGKNVSGKGILTTRVNSVKDLKDQTLHYVEEFLKKGFRE